MTDFVFKILTLTQWQEFQEKKIFYGSTHDLRDGFIHLATQTQYSEVISRYFAQELKVVLVKIKFDQNNMVFEKTSNGEEFPHLYHRPLHFDEVIDFEIGSNFLT